MDSQSAMDQCQDALDLVESHLKFLTQKPLEEVLAGMTDFERVKLKTVLDYAVTTLQLCYLRSKGESIEGHPNLLRLEQIKSFFTQIDKCLDANGK
jgi:hypothetical protein